MPHLSKELTRVKTQVVFVCRKGSRFSNWNLETILVGRQNHQIRRRATAIRGIHNRGGPSTRCEVLKMVWQNLALNRHLVDAGITAHPVRQRILPHGCDGNVWVKRAVVNPQLPHGLVGEVDFVVHDVGLADAGSEDLVGAELEGSGVVPGPPVHVGAGLPDATHLAGVLRGVRGWQRGAAWNHVVGRTGEVGRIRLRHAWALHH